MFDNLKGIGALAGMMKDLPRLKEQVGEVRQKLEELTVEADAGGGAVRVTANGLLKVMSVRVDQALMAALVDAADPDDRAMAEDLIAGAVNAALAKARELSSEEIRQAASQAGINLPPGPLTDFLG